MKAITLAVVAMAALAFAVYATRPSVKRDRIEEGINKAGHFGAFYGLDRAMEEYALRHYGQVPDSIEPLAAAEMSELGAEEEPHALMYAAILRRTIIKPFFVAPDGREYTWFAAVLVPKGTVDEHDYVYFVFGMSGPGFHDYARLENFERDYGKPLASEVLAKNSTPAPLAIEKKRGLATVVGQRDGSSKWRWYVTLSPTAATKPIAPASTTQSVRIWESPRISTFQRTLTFAEGAWRLPDGSNGILDSQACRLALRVKGNGACGDDTVRLNLDSMRGGVIALPTIVYADNTAKVLHLTLQDADGRTATWIYDVLTPSQARLRPRDGATLARPNVPPADGEAIDLRRINKWKLSADSTNEVVLSIEIDEMIIE